MLLFFPASEFCLFSACSSWSFCFVLKASLIILTYSHFSSEGVDIWLGALCVWAGLVTWQTLLYGEQVGIQPWFWGF